MWDPIPRAETIHIMDLILIMYPIPGVNPIPMVEPIHLTDSMPMVDLILVVDKMPIRAFLIVYYIPSPPVYRAISSWVIIAIAIINVNL